MTLAEPRLAAVARHSDPTLAQSMRLFRAELEHWSQVPESDNIVRCYGGALVSAADFGALTPPSSPPALNCRGAPLDARACLLGRDFLVLELIEAGSLAERIKERNECNRPFTVREARRCHLAATRSRTVSCGISTALPCRLHLIPLSDRCARSSPKLLACRIAKLVDAPWQACKSSRTLHRW